MSLLRDIWADLVEKRLWPVAALLVVGMIAAPVVLAGGSGEQTTAAPVAAPAPAPPAASAGPAALPVSLDEAPAQPAPRGGYKDPFAGSVKAAAKASAPTTAAAPAPPATSATPAPGSDGLRDTPTGSAAPAPAASPPVTAPVDPITAPDTTPDAPPSSGVFAGYRVDLRWGRAGATKRMRDVVRLGRLDAGEEPLLVYLGVRRDGKRALFLLTTDAGTVGDGRCMPSTKSCQVIELTDGESQFFDVEDAGGAIAQYELDVDRIVRRTAESRARADTLRERQSKRGRQLMYDAIERGRDYSTSFMYRSSLGALVRDVKATTAWFSQASYDEVDVPSGE